VKWKLSLCHVWWGRQKWNLKPEVSNSKFLHYNTTQVLFFIKTATQPFFYWSVPLTFCSLFRITTLTPHDRLLQVDFVFLFFFNRFFFYSSILNLLWVERERMELNYHCGLFCENLGWFNCPIFLDKAKGILLPLDLRNRNLHHFKRWARREAKEREMSFKEEVDVNGCTLCKKPTSSVRKIEDGN